MVTRWWWVRHGPVPSQKGLIYGQRDVSCDTSDVAAFQRLAKTLPETLYFSGKDIENLLTGR